MLLAFFHDSKTSNFVDIVDLSLLFYSLNHPLFFLFAFPALEETTASVYLPSVVKLILSEPSCFCEVSGDVSVITSSELVFANSSLALIT